MREDGDLLQPTESHQDLLEPHWQRIAVSRVAALVLLFFVGEASLCFCGT